MGNFRAIGEPIGIWSRPATIAPNRFVFKALSAWAFNTAVGCSHACRFCYVPEASTIKMSGLLARHGVNDPDEEWGSYALLRRWDEKAFLASLRRAEGTPLEELPADGNRAVIFSSTTDAWQVFRHRDTRRRRELNDAAGGLVRRALELIRDNSTLNVRVLTRSPLARRDFDLFRSLGPRLLFGVSLPTLNADLARLYEPHAPSPAARLKLLQAAHAAGIPCYAAVAPVPPESDDQDLRATLQAVARCAPLTVFAEPINIRAENVQRIALHAQALGMAVRTECFQSPEAWASYSIAALHRIEALAAACGLRDRLHLWPDKALGGARFAHLTPSPAEHQAWLQSWWHRRSEWPN